MLLYMTLGITCKRNLASMSVVRRTEKITGLPAQLALTTAVRKYYLLGQGEFLQLLIHQLSFLGCIGHVRKAHFFFFFIILECENCTFVSLTTKSEMEIKFEWVSLQENSFPLWPGLSQRMNYSVWLSFKYFRIFNFLSLTACRLFIQANIGLNRRLSRCRWSKLLQNLISSQRDTRFLKMRISLHQPPDIVSEITNRVECASERSIGICFTELKTKKGKNKNKKKNKVHLVEEFPFGSAADGHTAKCACKHKKKHYTHITR